MPQVRSFTNPFETTDFTRAINVIPNEWNMTQTMGLWTEESVTEDLFALYIENHTLGLIKDQPRGGKNNVNRDDLRKLISFLVPHYPVDDYLTPKDVRGKIAYGSSDAKVKETWQDALGRKLKRMRRLHSDTLEFARMKAITTGTVWSPNGTAAANYYTDFGVTRTEVNFQLNSGATEVVAKNEQVIAGIQDNIMNGQTMTDIVGLVSPEFFSAYVTQAGVKDAYRYFSSSPNPLRDRLGSGKGRIFDHAGLILIEYRGTAANGERFIPAGDAYFFPLGTDDMFVTYYAPAEKFADMNTLGEKMYAWVYPDEKDEKITIQTESNFLNLIRRPQAIIRGYIS